MVETRINARLLRQKNYELYLFSMKSSDLIKFCYVTPRSKGDPSEVQRLLNPKRVQEIGDYIKQETSMLPNAIVVSFVPDVIIERTGKTDEVIIKLPTKEGKYAYILDGQHRLAGFEHAEGIEYDLPVVGLWNISDDLRGKIFADINSKQVKVTDVHLLSLYYQIKELPSEESATMDVVTILNKDKDSPLYCKIKILDDDTGCWVTNQHIKRCIAPLTETGGCLSGKNAASQAVIIKEYLKGVSKLWENPWGNNKEYMLTKAMGIELILGLFPSVKHRCDLNEGRQYTAKSFSKQLEPIVGCSIELPGGGGELRITWERGELGMLSNKAGKAWIRKKLISKLINADE